MKNRRRGSAGRRKSSRRSGGRRKVSKFLTIPRGGQRL